MTDDVYRERARLVAHLASLFPSVLSYNDPDEPDWPVVYVDAPAGQLSWHIAPGDVGLFGHVQLVDPGDPRAKWDGHTPEEKYDRLAKLTAAGPALAPGLVARPGDTLVIGTHRVLTTEEIDDMDRLFQERMPGVKVAVVEEATALAVYRPGGEGTAP